MLKPTPFEQPVYVTRPLLPSLARYAKALEEIWDRQWLTNKGPVHDAFESALSAHLRTPHLSLVGNGTLALSLICNAFDLRGEIVTTAFTSPATPNAVNWIGLTPVFADIDPETWTLDPAAVERALTPNTSAILGVHVFGMPCDTEALQAIADRHGLRLIYDGAHAFGTEVDGRSLLSFGDATTLSFHATKFFNTAEGGAVVVQNPEHKERVDLLRTLGIRDEVRVLLPGINARMNELEAALGLANLERVAAEHQARAALAEVYRSRLANIEGLAFFTIPQHVTDSHNYFVVRIDEIRCRVGRDDLYEKLKPFNVFARRYFYPLCSDQAFYRDRPSSRSENLPVSHRVAREVLCLPFYGGLSTADAGHVCDIIEYVVRA